MEVYYPRENYRIGKSRGNFSNCIIDVGCQWTGERGKAYKQQFGLPCIFIDADQFALDRLAINEEDLMLLAAVSSKPGIGKFHLYREACHSLQELDLDQVPKWMDSTTGRPSTVEDWQEKDFRYVPKITLESLIQDLQIEHVAALKIDAQGHDLEIVKGLGNYINRVSIIEIEVVVTDYTVYKNEHTKNEVMEFMLSHGFELFNVQAQSCNQEENLYFKNTRPLLTPQQEILIL